MQVKKSIYLILLPFVTVILFSFSFLNDDFYERLKLQLEKFNLSHPQEKVYIHFDKPYYSLGEDIWFKVYLVDASLHTPTAFSKTVYVELINSSGDIIDKKTIGLDNIASGDFHLDQSLASGKYTVRAYTSFMRNFDDAYFFTKVFNVWDSKASIEDQKILNTQEAINLPVSLQFFPEGGNMVNGLLNYVGFKAISSDGKGVDVAGHIENNLGEKVMDFNSSIFGMGMFVMVPKPRESYIAKVNYNGVSHEVPLPQAEDTGVIMHVDNKENQYSIRLYSNKPGGIGDVLIVGQQRSKIFCNVRVNANKASAIAVIDKSLLKDGIGQFTLFDSKGNPLCERLVFKRNENTTDPKLRISELKETYERREKIELQLNIQDSSNAFIDSDLSISVTDLEVVVNNDSNDNIISNLLLSSDIKGTIEYPGYYFNIDNPERSRHLDILMLTQGWRRFTWKEVLNDSITTFNHLLESGLSINGNVSTYNNRSKSVKAKVSLSSLQAPFINDEAETNANGKFVFTGYNFIDSTELILQAKRSEGKKSQKNNASYFITIEETNSPPVDFKQKLTSPLKDSNVEDYIDRSADIFKLDSVYQFDTDVIILEGVKIQATKDPTKQPFYRAETNYAKPDSRVVMDSLPGAKNKQYVFDILQGNVPGVVVSGSFPNHKVKIRGNNSILGANQPLYVLNGMPVDYSNVYNISPSEIDFIDVLKGASAAAYGIRGASGVIAIYTKLNKSGNSKTYKGITNYTHPGYSIAREFYHPTYDVKKKEHAKPDYRTTLYWNPNIKLEEGGDSKILFFGSDQPSTYRIEIEGITNTGIPIRHESYFHIE